MAKPWDIGAAVYAARAGTAPHTHHPSIDCGRDCAGVDPTFRPTGPLPADPWALPNPALTGDAA